MYDTRHARLTVYKTHIALCFSSAPPNRILAVENRDPYFWVFCRNCSCIVERKDEGSLIFFDLASELQYSWSGSFGCDKQTSVFGTSEMVGKKQIGVT
jgi:hypothetical protein